jgi:hypothetical protein
MRRKYRRNRTREAEPRGFRLEKRHRRTQSSPDRIGHLADLGFHLSAPPSWTTPMTKFVHGFAWLAILSTAHAQTLNLAPSYDALEAGPGYSRVGKATIKPLSDTAYDIEWNFDGEVVKGFGMRFNDMLTCTFMYGNEPGLVVYKIDGGVLDGVWTVRHGLATGSERLTPSK